LVKDEGNIKYEDQVLDDFNAIKGKLKKDDVIICQHLGTFNQHKLISIISLVENALVENGEYLSLQKRLSYLVIECIHNIIFHSNVSPKDNHLAYILIVNNKLGYTIYSSNIIGTENINSLEDNLDELLAQKKRKLSNLFQKKIKNPEINENGYAGLGLLTIIDKSGKGFKYIVTKLTPAFALFHIELDIKYKN
jgi:hypothetical protein